MKKTSFIYSLAATFMTAAVALGGLTACSSEDNIVNNDLQQNAEVKTYTVSIPASMGDDAETRAVTFDNSGATPTAISTFATSDKIYVYRKSPTTAWLSYNGGSYDYLSPSQNGKSCTLTGDITGSLNVGDVLELYYNMNLFGMNGDPSDGGQCAFDYWGQDGTASSVADFAIATVKVKSIDAGVITFCQETDNTDETAHFENLSSMFRFKFTDGTSPISVKNLRVTSLNPALLLEYAPMATTTKCYPLSISSIPVNLATATSDYIYAGIGIDESSNDGSAMNFDVVDADGKVYSGSKAAPTGGFKKGKYYYSTSATAELTHQYTIQYPTITWATPSTGIEPDFGLYQFDVDNFDFTLSGTSSSVRFDMGVYAAANGTVRLNGLTATFDDFAFIYNRGDLTLDITGNNTITCKNHSNCIVASSHNLKLSGNGTLTVTANADGYCGLAAGNYNSANNSYATTTELDVSAALAAPGYKVTRSARTLNIGGT